MAWLRLGDNLVTHPGMSKLLSATDLDHGLNLDHQLKNECFSVFVQLATVSAAHLTDAWVEMGMIAQIAPGREKPILDVLVAAGLAERVKVDGRWMIKLVLDDEEFVHARKRDEVLIDRRRSADKRNDSLMIPVRVRDGDQCRWCDRTVSWGNRSGSRGGTIDSLNGHKSSTVETLVVACRGCNSKRHEGGIELDLKEEPGQPYYTDHTIELVNGNKWAQEQGIHIKPRQTSLDLDKTTTQAAVTRQQDSDQAAHGRSGSSTLVGAAPTVSAAPDTSTAPETAPGNDPFEDAPEWVTSSLEEILAEKAKAAATHGQAAPGIEGDVWAAAWSRQQSDTQAAAPDQGAAPGAEAAPDQAAPALTPQESLECNETVKPGPNPDREGDEPGLVGSGRDGSDREETGRTGTDRGPRRPRRRGRRGGRRK